MNMILATSIPLKLNSLSIFKRLYTIDIQLLICKPFNNNNIFKKFIWALDCSHLKTIFHFN